MYNKINVQRHKEHRKCLNCGKEWDIWKQEVSKTGKKVLFCNDCNSRLSNSEKMTLKKLRLPGYKEHYLKLKRQEFIRGYKRKMLRAAKDRAIKLGLPFNITMQDIIIPEECPILEKPIIIGDKNNYEYSPSLDRIDNSKGYVKGNVAVISKKANSMKNSATIEELKSFCKNILRYSLNSTEYESAECEDKEPCR